MATTTLFGNVGLGPATVYFTIRPLGAYAIDTGAAITNPDPIVDASGQWTQALEVNTNVSPPGSYWEVWENIPGADRVWAVRLQPGQTPTVQTAQIPQPRG